MNKLSGLDPETAYMQVAPAQYINQEDILKKAGDYIIEWGTRALISGGEKGLKSVEGDLLEALDQKGIYWEKHIFHGEVARSNIEVIKRNARAMQADVIIGVGGGKAIDAAKAASEDLGLPVVTIPTVAATCAAASPLAVMYTEEGTFDYDYFMTQNPQLVMVDPKVIANAPSKYLLSGILDSFAKWYEGKAVESGISDPNLETVMAMSLASVLYEKLRQNAIVAFSNSEENKVSTELKETVDIIIYLTAIIQSVGKNTSRGAAAHAIHNGVTVIPESHDVLHGLKVGYGIVVQLYLENKPQDYIDDVVDFFGKLGLTPSLKGLGMPYSDDNLKKVAAKTMNDTLMLRMPEKISQEMLIEAMKKAEEYFD